MLTLICKISDALREKRYIMVVDDIWDVKTWDVIRHAFPMTSCGSIIITTTRVIDVAYSCRSSIGGHIYNIKPLNMVHSKQLFHRRLFNSEEDCSSSLEKASDQILKKCGGLPLAIIAISGLLANTEKTEQQWNQVKDSIGRALERNPSVEGMIKILSLSYYYLPPRLKGCLLYVSIFPEDSCIHRHMLICRWIAEGLIHKEGKYTAYEIGKRCFNELINRSLIQLVLFDKCEEVCACRVHDTILDFIISKSIEENFVTYVGVPGLTTQTQSIVRRLSIQVEGEGISVVPTGLSLSHVRSLNVFADRVEIPSMMEFRHLRVMDFENCKQLENRHLANIGRLLQLRYLNIHITHVKDLPEDIGHLRYLEILDISAIELNDLPAGIVSLRKLTHLFVHDSVKFPDGIANLQALETLKWLRASVQSYNFLQELGQLKNLRKLHFSHWQVAQEHKEVIASSLHNLCAQNLRSLTLSCAGDSTLLNTWCTSPQLDLQKLFIQHSSFTKVPDWVGSLMNLQKLSLELESIQHEDLCLLGALPALLTLELTLKSESHCEDRKLTISRETGFRCLRVFTYVVPDETMFSLMFGARSMPMLQKLTLFIVDCLDIEYISSSGALDFGIENLSSLVSFRCEFDCPDAVKASVKRMVSAHPNNNLTLIFNCQFC
ncbi:disease resistance protein RGA5-like [Triticum dicoccoides]|uniref:NB-ARC domain-containing protein n=1 Tax=Triticum turgidum subsp. durum TaxID=4567 RepID=A0A9R0YZJ1_TRITD|nr:disease resistance protein RGA5-like [Triticum dicoccoides]VAI63656.1 unnamed protein product [Triticum turgidum subsp. durum]